MRHCGCIPLTTIQLNADSQLSFSSVIRPGSMKVDFKQALQLARQFLIPVERHNGLQSSDVARRCGVEG
jgi:hypothetical protein